MTTWLFSDQSFEVWPVSDVVLEEHTGFVDLSGLRTEYGNSRFFRIGGNKTRNPSRGILGYSRTLPKIITGDIGLFENGKARYVQTNPTNEDGMTWAHRAHIMQNFVLHECYMEPTFSLWSDDHWNPYVLDDEARPPKADEIKNVCFSLHESLVLETMQVAHSLGEDLEVRVHLVMEHEDSFYSGYDDLFFAVLHFSDEHENYSFFKDVLLGNPEFFDDMTDVKSVFGRYHINDDSKIYRSKKAREYDEGGLRFGCITLEESLEIIEKIK